MALSNNPKIRRKQLAAIKLQQQKKQSVFGEYTYEQILDDREYAVRELNALRKEINDRRRKDRYYKQKRVEELAERWYITGDE